MPIREYQEQDYNYKFNVSYSRRGSDLGPIEGLVWTDSSGDGTISIRGNRVPINLRGKGMSKAVKKARGILYWWATQDANKDKNKAFHKYVPTQKRPSERRRKRIRRASRRSHMGYSHSFSHNH